MSTHLYRSALTRVVMRLLVLLVLVGTVAVLPAQAQTAPQQCTNACVLNFQICVGSCLQGTGSSLSYGLCQIACQIQQAGCGLFCLIR